MKKSSAIAQTTARCSTSRIFAFERVLPLFPAFFLSNL